MGRYEDPWTAKTRPGNPQQTKPGLTVQGKPSFRKVESPVTYCSLLSFSLSTLSLNPYSRLWGKFDTSTPSTSPKSCKRPSPSRTNPNRCRPKAKPRGTCRDRLLYESPMRKRWVLSDLSISVLHMSCLCNASELFYCHYTKTVLIFTISLKLIHQGSLQSEKYHISLIRVPGKYQDGLLGNFCTNPLWNPPFWKMTQGATFLINFFLPHFVPRCARHWHEKVIKSF